MNKMKSIVILQLLIIGIINCKPLFPGLPTMRPFFPFGNNNNAATSEPVDNETTESSTQAMPSTNKWQQMISALPDFPNFPGLPGLPLPLPMLPFPFPLPMMFDMNNARLPNESLMERSTFDEEEELGTTTITEKATEKEDTTQERSTFDEEKETGTTTITGKTTENEITTPNSIQTTNMKEHQ